MFRLRLSKRTIVIAVVALLLLMMWKLEFPTRSYRYRLTIDLEKNGAICSGSSVVELNSVSTGFLGSIDNMPAWETHPRGEATFIDLGDGANLIALLDWQSTGTWLNTAILPSRVILGDDFTKMHSLRFDNLATLFPEKLSEAMGKSYPLRLDQLPPLIRLRNIDDPKTLEKVDPANLAATYGADLKFRDAHLEITQDPVTQGISQRLSWLSKLKPDKSLEGSSGVRSDRGEAPLSSAHQTAYYNFVRE